MQDPSYRRVFVLHLSRDHRLGTGLLPLRGASVADAIEKFQYDLYYVKNHCLFLDFMILISTVEVVLWGKGAR